MKNKVKFLIPSILIVFLFSLNSTNAQDTAKVRHPDKKHNMEMMKDSSMNRMEMLKGVKTPKMDMMNDSTHKMKMDKKEVKDSIIREGEIDLQAIDENKDGYVYQDLMDYNVISDKTGKCPICGMTLKKVSLKKAKDTLIKGGFKVKQ